MRRKQAQPFGRRSRWAILAASVVGVLVVASGFTLAQSGGAEDAAGTQSVASIDAESRAVLPGPFRAAIEAGEIGPPGDTSTAVIGRQASATDVPWSLVATEGGNGDTMLTLTSEAGSESGLFAPFDGYCKKSSKPLTLCGAAAAGRGATTTRVLVLGAKGPGIDGVKTTVGEVFDAGRFFAIIVRGESGPIAITGLGPEGHELGKLEVPMFPSSMPVVKTSS